MKIFIHFMICVTYHCNQSNSIVTIFTIYKIEKDYKKTGTDFSVENLQMILEKNSSKNRRREFSIPEQEDPNACNIMQHTFCLT